MPKYTYLIHKGLEPIAVSLALLDQIVRLYELEPWQREIAGGDASARREGMAPLIRFHESNERVELAFGALSYRYLWLELAVWAQTLTSKSRWRRRKPFNVERVYIVMTAICLFELAVLLWWFGFMRPLGAIY